jgi:hypothetical protein
MIFGWLTVRRYLSIATVMTVQDWETPLSQGFPNSIILATSSLTGQYIYVVEGKFYKSTDFGLTWTTPLKLNHAKLIMRRFL